MKFVVKECLSAGSAGFLRGVQPVLTASCSADCYSNFPGNGLVRIAAGPEYRKRRQMADRFDVGDLSREIAAYVPIGLVKKFGAQNLQCAGPASACVCPQQARPMHCPIQMQSIFILPSPRL
ncbi:hypothetical protein CQ13_09910 [Bradyrhizobium retamae]|uniref:Uncharacterized protein n=1 Tax=Bradyrhizobium retamae TaxID=1300035 RepID=A0A0R3MMU3_9BRAD|nr:hypothetical protein CQ13_09910 [Bradyrhizobium retamae]